MRRRARVGVMVLVVMAWGSVAGAADPSPGAAPPPGRASSPPITGTWFDGLAAGVCFDNAFDTEGNFDFSAPPAPVPCDGPHDDEVVARVSLGDGDLPDGIDEVANALCSLEHEAFLGRPAERSSLFRFNVWPDESDWAAGAHDVVCILYSRDRMVGTAASGSLRAPGEMLAAFREESGDADLWLVDAGTGDAVRNLTDSSVTKLLSAPGWAPDGSRIAFSISVGEDDSDILVVPVDDPDAGPLVIDRERQDGAAFSPDGTTLAFSSRAEATEPDIYTLDLATGVKTRLTDDPDRDSTPTWSPDGSRIAFRRRTDGVSNLWVMDRDGSNVAQLTGDGGDDYDPRWSPDGSRIAFTSDRAGGFDIWVVNADGTDPHPVTTHPANDEYPSWSRDGEILAFHSNRYGGTTLWLVRADGTDSSELTSYAPIGYPAFAPVPVE